jgi:hypothetical protein
MKFEYFIHNNLIIIVKLEYQSINLYLFPQKQPKSSRLIKTTCRSIDTFYLIREINTSEGCTMNLIVVS